MTKTTITNLLIATFLVASFFIIFSFLCIQGLRAEKSSAENNEKIHQFYKRCDPLILNLTDETLFEDCETDLSAIIALYQNLEGDWQDQPQLRQAVLRFREAQILALRESDKLRIFDSISSGILYYEASKAEFSSVLLKQFNNDLDKAIDRLPGDWQSSR